MTIPILSIIGYTAGAALALASRPALGDPIRLRRNRYLGACLMFSLLALLPAGLALYATFPDWSLMYLANPAHLPAFLIYPTLLISYLLGPPAGFLTTQRLMFRDRGWAVRGSIAGLMFLLFCTFLFGGDRLLVVAYYDGYHHGLERIPLHRSVLLVPLIIQSLAVLGVLVFTLRVMSRHSKPASAIAPQNEPQSAESSPLR